MYKTPLVENVFPLGLNDEPCKKTIDRVAAPFLSMSLNVWWIINYFPRLNRRPFIPFHPYAQSQQGRCYDYDRYSHLFPHIHFWLGGPVEEFHHVFGHLRRRRWRAVFVFDKSIVQNTSHCDSRPRKIRIEIQTRSYNCARRWFFRIARQQRKYIIAPPMSRLNHETEIWRERSVVRRAGCFIVLVWWRNVIREFPGPFFDLALVVGFGVVLVFFGHGFHFRRCVRDSHEGSPSDPAEGVAG